jgi:DNA-binding cell septation regulator SpoVG
MRLIGWRPLHKGQLLGFAAVELPVVGLQLFDIPVLRGREGVWASLPNRAELDEQRRQRVGPDGKPAYARIAAWRSKKLEQAFVKRVVELVRAVHPDDLAE